MELYNLGSVPWETSQLLYHALAEMGREALVLLSPSDPYVCIGYHQDVDEEIDLDFCKTREIPVFRRELGGGAVYLDGAQLFFQLILRRGSRLIPARRETFFKQFLQPVINTYRRIGVQAEYKAVNDVTARGRKISGTGVGEIGESVVFVGNLIMDFNVDMMTRVLRVPDEKFRDKVHKTMSENMTTIQKELGKKEAARWDEGTLNSIMAEEFQNLIGGFDPKGPEGAGGLDGDVLHNIAQIKEKLMSREWLHRKGRRRPDREVKIQAGVKLVQRAHKAMGGLIRASYEVRDGRFFDVSFSGDFFCYPKGAVEALASLLQGKPVREAKEVVETFFAGKEVEVAGVEAADWMEVLGGVHSNRN